MKKELYAIIAVVAVILIGVTYFVYKNGQNTNTQPQTQSAASNTPSVKTYSADAIVKTAGTGSLEVSIPVRITDAQGYAVFQNQDRTIKITDKTSIYTLSKAGETVTAKISDIKPGSRISVASSADLQTAVSAEAATIQILK